MAPPRTSPHAPRHAVADRTTAVRAPAGRATVRRAVDVPMDLAGRPTVVGRIHTFHGLVDGREHLAIRLGTPTPGVAPLVRLHSECLTGDVLGSTRCDCGPQLAEAVDRITAEGGWLLYLRQEGRDIGLYNKLDAYALQDAGLDTYEANHAVGFGDDLRDYASAAQMLTAVGATSIRLLSNNPDKAAQLRRHGIRVADEVATGVHAGADNLRYLEAKVRHTGHRIALPQPVDVTAVDEVALAG